MNRPEESVIESLAPTGELRVAINYGNPVLAQRGKDNEPNGVSAELAKKLAESLGVGFRFITFDAAGKVFASLDAGDWDIAFLARDPLRAEKIDFTAAYMHIEGTYLVPADSPLMEINELDRQGIKIAVGKGAAYDLYLSRTLKNAELVRAPTSGAAVELFVNSGLSAAAGVRQPLERYASAYSGYRVLEGCFTTIEQAMATPKGRGEGARYVSAFIEEQKASGFVKQALVNSGQVDVQVAPRGEGI